MVWRQPECRDLSVASCPPDSRAVPGACRQPPVPGPTSGRSRGRSITLAGTRCRRCSACPSTDGRPTRGRRLPSAATVTGQVRLDRRRSTHPRSPARAHHRTGLGGTGPSSAHPCRMTPKPGYTACSFHRSGSGLSGPGAPNKARARRAPQPDIPPASLAAKDPSLIAAWPPILTRDRTPVPSMSPALNPPMGTAWPGGPATDAGRVVAARQVVDQLSEEVRPCLDDLRRRPRPGARCLRGR